MYQDPEVAQIIRRLDERKREAVQEEHYDYAKKLKQAIADLQKVLPRGRPLRPAPDPHAAPAAPLPTAGPRQILRLPPSPLSPRPACARSSPAAPHPWQAC